MRLLTNRRGWVPFPTAATEKILTALVLRDNYVGITAAHQAMVRCGVFYWRGNELTVLLFCHLYRAKAYHSFLLSFYHSSFLSLFLTFSAPFLITLLLIFFLSAGLGLDNRGSRVRFPAEAGNFSLHHRVQDGSGAHPPSYPMGSRGSFPAGKVAGA
jgi:hypothetical protein